jgi:hypothetical protein
MTSQFLTNKNGAKNARSQRRFNLFILFLTALLWLYIINGIANELTK